MSTFSAQEKSRIFVERTRELWPENWENYLELIRHEKFSKEELMAYNFKRRVEILQYAYENTKFYKKLYDEAGINPYEIRTEDDWNRVPIVTKQMISDHSDEFEVKEDIEKYGFVANTGGSTGKPLRVFRDKRHFWHAPFWRMTGWYLGREVGNPYMDAPIWGIDQSYIGRDQYRFSEAELRQRDVAFWPIKYSYLDCYADFKKAAPKYLEEIKKSPMHRIYAYSGGIDMLADYCIKNNIPVPSNIAFAELCASPVTKLIREKVERALGCKVFDLYGSNEIGPMAVECAHSGEEHHLHVLYDLLHMELVDDKGNLVNGEEVGTTIITCFDNKVFPFVRYNHGDKTHWINKTCDCGLPFPIIAPVRGRISDYLVTNEGLHVDGVGFNEVFDFNPEAALSFQFRQKVDGYVTLVVVPNPRYADSMKEINAILNKLNNDFKGQIEFTLECVDSIDADGGKTRYIVHL